MHRLGSRYTDKKRLTDVLKFIQTGITTLKGYPLQNAIPKKDTLIIEMMVGTYVL
jgi:hypothetical protein